MLIQLYDLLAITVHQPSFTLFIVIKEHFDQQQEQQVLLIIRSVLLAKFVVKLQWLLRIKIVMSDFIVLQALLSTTTELSWSTTEWDITSTYAILTGRAKTTYNLLYQEHRHLDLQVHITQLPVKECHLYD